MRLLTAALLLLPATLAAQTTTGTIRGRITDQNGAPLGGAEVRTTNVASGVVRTTGVQSNGGYVLPGLVPGTYLVEARQIGHSPQRQQVDVRIGATLSVDFALQAGALELAAVTVEAPPTIEMRTSEVATNVTSQQINDLPTSSRNVLDLATLAPGTTIENDRIDGTARRFSAGAQSADQINVFIDGASYKNDLIHGGVVGQDRSRGNPFPRNAIQEFRILTQNYKAEYQKSSSAVLTATTRSGGNTWSGSVFTTYQDQGLVALDTFALAAKSTNPNFEEPDYKRWLAGISVGGPLIRDRLHLFASYEGNYQDRSNLVNIVPPAGFPALDTIDFASRNGFYASPFRATLLFGKLTYAATENSSLEFSYNTRHETDTRDFGGNRPFESGVRFKNDVSTGILKFRHFSGAWVNEAAASYQRARDNPSPVPGTETINRFFGGSFCCAQIGPDITIQDFTQKRLALRNDLTYSGLAWNGQHVLKLGASLDFLNYRVLKRNSAIPRFVFEEFAPAEVDSFAFPERVEFRAGNPNFVTDNTQFGIYLQDDWSVTSRLVLNLGIRWDYETHMLNYDYVTPQGIVDSLTKYADSLLIPIDPNRYFTDGTQRPRFTGAFQPRLGFSLALDEEARTVVFGGFGIFYDRTLFDQAVEEEFAQRQPRYLIRFRAPTDTTSGRVAWNDRFMTDPTALDSLRRASPQDGAPEVKLIPNDLRPPKSRHLSAGIRRLFGDFAVEAAYTSIRSSNVFTFYWANEDRPCGDFTCGVRHTVPGFSTILVATNNGKTWYDALQVKVDRPYRSDGGVSWGAGLAYTLAQRQTEGFNDDFSFLNASHYPKQVRNDERHRLVSHFLMDLPFAYGIQFSGVLTLGSGVPRDIGDRFQPDTADAAFVPGGFDTPTFKNLDLRLRKDFPALRGGRFSVALDVFNAFNWQNLGDFETFNPADTANFGKARQVISDPRRFQLGIEYFF